MKQLKIAITSGGTKEYIDDIRIITNISTGRLGAMIGSKFISHGHQLYYVAPKEAYAPNAYDQSVLGYDRRITTDTNSVMEVMKELVPQMDVVIQCMAISDFTFNRDKPVKVSSQDLEGFINYMKQTIVKTPKVISNFRTWNPDAILVGFKFTVGKTTREMVGIAKELMEKNKLDMVLANDKMAMKKAGEHVGMLIMKDWLGKDQREKVRDKVHIAELIYKRITEKI